MWPNRHEILALIRKTGGNKAEIAKALGRSRTTVKDFLDRENYSEAIEEARQSYRKSIQKDILISDDDFLSKLHASLVKTKSPTLEDLANNFDVAPKVIRAGIDDLVERGYRVKDLGDFWAIQKRTLPEEKIINSSLEGDEFEIGLVADTHLSSNEQSLSGLHHAYDTFSDRGITEVYHAGDWTCGVGIFPQQTSSIFNHTYESQVDYLLANYPARNGIQTIGISGNHDIEGAFGRIGANPVSALANARSDITFAGDYSARIKIPSGPQIHLLHGKGGLGYSYVARAKKQVDSYQADKPTILAIGHWHVQGVLEHEGVQVIFPGCFEWKSSFMERLALTPAVGFYILHIKLNSDGELIKFLPEWFRITHAD